MSGAVAPHRSIFSSCSRQPPIGIPPASNRASPASGGRFMTEQTLVQWITDYGYFGIFFLLIFGIIGLPVPDEWLLVISGYLAFKNVLGFVPTVAVAVLGSAGGLTLRYVLRRTSSGFLI